MKEICRKALRSTCSQPPLSYLFFKSVYKLKHTFIHLLRIYWCRHSQHWMNRGYILKVRTLNLPSGKSMQMRVYSRATEGERSGRFSLGRVNLLYSTLQLAKVHVCIYLYMYMCVRI